jgi:hypothetical protein
MKYDVSKLPAVRARFERDPAEAVPDPARDPANLVGAASPVPAKSSQLNLPRDLKTMAFQGGRYYVVSEKK